jgi:hypothetical protein
MNFFKLLLISLCCFVFFNNKTNAQFSLKIPGGQMVGLTRYEDTLYFWGGSKIWKSTDFGETMIEWKNLNNGSGGYVIPGNQGGAQINYSSGTRAGYFHFKSTLMTAGYFKSEEWLFVPKFDRIFSEKFESFQDNPLIGMRVGPLHLRKMYLPTYSDLYEFTYLESDGTKKTIELNFNVGASSTYPNIQLYNNHLFIAHHENKIKTLSTIDSTVNSVDVPSGFDLATSSFQQISDSIIAITNSLPQYLLFNTHTQTIETKNHAIFPYQKKWLFEGEFAYQTPNNIIVSNITTGLIDTLLNLPTGYQNMDFYFTGSQYLMFFDRSNESIIYSRDIGVHWQMVNNSGMYSNVYQNVFNTDGYIYAQRNKKLFRVSCATPTKFMEYVRTLQYVFTTNLKTTMIFDGKYSVDFGQTYSNFALPNLYLDDTHNKMYVYGTTQGNGMRLFRSNDLGVTWDTIAIPVDSYNGTNKPKGFAAIGDTLLLYDFKSFDGGLTWTNSNINVSQYTDASIFDAVNGVFYFNVRKYPKTGYVSYSFNGDSLNAYIINGPPETGYKKLKHHEKQNTRLAIMNSPERITMTLNRVFALNYASHYVVFGGPLNSNYIAGLTDNYLYINYSLYPLGQHLVDIPTCKINNQYNQQNYTYGDFILSGDACQVDSIVRFSLSALPVVTLPKKYVCEGDTLLFNGKIVTGNATLRDTLNTPVGCDTLVSQDFVLFPKENTSETVSCQGTTVTLNGVNYQNDTTFVSGFDYSPSDSCVRTNWQKIVFLPIAYDTLPAITFCEGQNVCYNGIFYYNNVYLVSNYYSTSYGKCTYSVRPIKELPFAKDTLDPIVFCGDTPMIYNGVSYSDLDYVLTSQDASRCTETYQQLVRKPIIKDTLDPILICGNMPILYNGVNYPNLTYVLTYSDDNTCEKKYQQLIQRPVTNIVTDTFALDSLVLFGLVFKNNSSFTQKYKYHNSNCDSLVLKFIIHITSSSATNEAIDVTKITVSPNPANELLNFQTDYFDKSSKIDLIDAHGKTRKSVSIAQKQTKIDVFDLESGLYYWKYYFEGYVFSGKIVVQK